MNNFPVLASESLAKARQPKRWSECASTFARGTAAFARSKLISNGRVAHFILFHGARHPQDRGAV